MTKKPKQNKLKNENKSTLLDYQGFNKQTNLTSPTFNDYNEMQTFMKKKTSLEEGTSSDTI